MTPEELFGPYSLSGLKADKYIRNIEGSILDSVFAYLDEVFNGNDSTMQAFQVPMESKKFHQNGSTISIPLKFLMGTGNHLPDDERMQILGAYWDRFVLRFHAPELQEEDNIRTMMVNYADKRKQMSKLSITFEELEQAYEEVDQVTIPTAIFDNMLGIYQELAKEGIVVSGRKLNQALDIIRAHAWLNGRDQVENADLLILQHVFWNNLNEVTKVARTVLDMSNPVLRELEDTYNAVATEWNKVKDSKDPADKLEVQTTAREAVKTLFNKAKELPESDKAVIRPMLAKCKEIVEKIRNELYGAETEDLTLD